METTCTPNAADYSPTRRADSEGDAEQSEKTTDGTNVDTCYRRLSPETGFIEVRGVR